MAAGGRGLPGGMDSLCDSGLEERMSLTSELLKERKSPEKWQEEVDALTAKIAELSK